MEAGNRPTGGPPARTLAGKGPDGSPEYRDNAISGGSAVWAVVLRDGGTTLALPLQKIYSELSSSNAITVLDIYSSEAKHGH